MNRELAFCTGMGVGAGLLYFLDPEVGRRRRALCRDQFIRAAHEMRECADATWKDVQNRASGLVAEASSTFTRDQASDQVIHDRVRSKMGRYVSHPRAIEVAVRDGHVTLSGPILASDVNCLLNCVRGIAGVRGVENHLDVHEQAGNIQALQGGGRPRGETWDILQANWSRLCVGCAGAGLLAFGLTEESPTSWILGAAGLALLATSAAGSQRPWPFIGGEQQRTQAPRAERPSQMPQKAPRRELAEA